MEVIAITYKSTNIYLIPCTNGWVMIDAGWPGTLYNVQHLLQNNISINDIKYLIITHFHPDHAGLTQNFKEYGAVLILHEVQVPFVARLNEFFKKHPDMSFNEIDLKNTIVVSCEKSRPLL